MRKHTPGPWEWEWLRSERFALNGNGGDEVIGTFRDGGMDIGEADARLIAAAPDLLEALKGASVVIDACIRNTATVPVPGISRIMRAAIAKAEGE